MQLLAKVTKVMSGSTYTDKVQRIEIKVKDAPWGSNELQVPNTDRFALDQALTISIAPVDEGDEF